MLIENGMRWDGDRWVETEAREITPELHAVKEYDFTMKPPKHGRVHDLKDHQYLSAHEALTISPDEFALARKGWDFTNNFERIIFEETPHGQSAILSPHFDYSDQTPRRFRIEQMQRRLRCSFHQAKRVVEAFKVIEADDKIIDQFAEKSLKAPEKIEKHIEYIEMLASELAAVTGSVTQTKETPPRSAWLSEYSNTDTHGVEAMLRRCERLTLEENEEEDPIFTLPDPDDYDSLKEGDEEEDEELDLEEVEDREEQEKEPCDTEAKVLADGFRYHKVETESAMESKDWLAKQPETYKSLIQRVQNCKTQDALSQIRKLYADKEQRPSSKSVKAQARKAGFGDSAIEKFILPIIRGNKSFMTPIWEGEAASEEIRVDGGYMTISGDVLEIVGYQINPGIRKYFEKFSSSLVGRLDTFFKEVMPPLFTEQQRTYFWAVANAQKEYVQRREAKARRIAPGSQAERLIDKIIACKKSGPLGFLGIKLREFQQGTIGKCTLSSWEWTAVWNCYRAHKEFLKSQEIVTKEAQAKAA